MSRIGFIVVAAMGLGFVFGCGGHLAPCIGVDGGACVSAGGGGGSAGGGSATGGGSSGGGSGGGAQVHAATACPHIDLGTATTVSYTGNNTGLPDWVQSTRLEWTDAPDDSLLFTAPSAGMYAFDFTDSTTSNGGMGVSIRDMNSMFWGSCPAAATGTMIDGFFESPGFPATLTAGQQVLIYVSTTSWAVPSHTGAYTLTITKQ